MTHSRRKTPICGNGGGSEKKDKIILHRRLRRIAKVMLKKLNEDFMEPKKNEILNLWDMRKDGKSWFGSFGDEEYKEKLMRK